jgi:hypothetical protein
MNKFSFFLGALTRCRKCGRLWKSCLCLVLVAGLNLHMWKEPQIDMEKHINQEAPNANFSAGTTSTTMTTTMATMTNTTTTT